MSEEATRREELRQYLDNLREEILDRILETYETPRDFLTEVVSFTSRFNTQAISKAEEVYPPE
jgi:hypothetical protein